MNGPDLEILIAVAAMAAVTYGLRLGGLLLAGRLPKSGRWAVALQRLPGTVLVALVAPAILHAGPLGWVAAAACALCAWRTGNLLLSMGIAVFIVGIGRSFL